MTTLVLDDALTERLTRFAAAQGKTLDALATEALQRLAESAPAAPASANGEARHDVRPADAPATLADELRPYLERIRVEQAAEPDFVASGEPERPFGDHLEEYLHKHWADDLRRENTR